MTAMYSFECQTCGARLDIGSHERTTSCAYCASPSVIERPPAPDRPNPSFAVGFTVPRERALAHARTWLTRALLAPQAFRRAAVQAVSGVYIPAYLYTTAAYSWYRAKIGEAYTDSETYTTTNTTTNTTTGREGDRVTKTRNVTKYEWRSLSGEHAVYISDHVVTASRGLSDDELQGITPFDLRSLQRFSPMLISGWAAEEPSISKHRSMEMARAAARSRIRQQLDDFMPGDRHRLLEYDTEFHDEHMELALLPVWILPVRYNDDKPAVRLLINGQTGQVWGRSPISWVKVAALAVFAIAAAILLYIYVPRGS